MKIMIGDTVEKHVEGEKHWVKAEVVLDETDLGRLLKEAGLDPDLPVSSREAFNFLEVEAEILLGGLLVLREALDMATYTAGKDVLEARKVKTIKKLEARLSAGSAAD